MSKASELQRQLSGWCLIISPVIGLVAEVVRYEGNFSVYVWSGTLALLSIAVSVQSILALRHLLSARAPRLAVWGCGLALVLMLSGPAIIGSYLVSWSLLPDMPAADTALRASFAKLFFIIFLPGLLYTICRALIGVGLWRTRVVPTLVGLAMALGWVLIPAGRLPHIPSIVYLGSVLILAGEGWLGWRILVQPTLWRETDRGDMT